MYKYVKHSLDFFFAFICLIIVSPVMIIIGVLLFIFNKGQIFFIQERPGLRGEPFLIIKFKTMNEDKDIDGNLLPDEQRLHFVGKILRKASIDELPQLVNVLKGDMSLIGPRPLLMEYLPLYSNEQKKRHNVCPGITGWAQVNGRNAISWRKKFELDVWYIKNLSMMLDVKILWFTFLKVIKSEEVSKHGHATTEKFKGNN